MIQKRGLIATVFIVLFALFFTPVFAIVNINNCGTGANGLHNPDYNSTTDCADNWNLTADITCTVPMDPICLTNLFTGNFSGNNHTITGLNINCSGTPCGMISQGDTSSSTVVIRDLTVNNAYITNGPSDDYIGALIGSTATTISNCHVSNSMVTSGNGIAGGFAGDGIDMIKDSSVVNSTIIGTSNNVGGLVGTGNNINNSYAQDINVTTAGDYAGGVAGDTSGWIDNSYATGNVSGNTAVGGLVGSSQSPISDSYSTCYISGAGQRVGGLVGNTGSSVIDCYATGNVYGGSDYVGGLVGYLATLGSIKRSYATGVVYGAANYVGGLSGLTGGLVTNSYATGNVTGASSVGGLVGVHGTGGSVTYSYSTGNVIGSTNGFIGFTPNGGCSNDFWDNQSSGQVAGGCTGALPKTTTQMKNVSTFTGAGWNFGQNWSMSTIINEGYPYLQWRDFGTAYSSFGAGTTEFDSVSNKNNVTGAKIVKTGSIIAWNNGINANGADFDSNTAIGSGFVSINSSKFDSSINSSANVTLITQSCNGLVIKHASAYYTSLGDVLANGVDCTTDGSCSNVQCVQGATTATVTFTAAHFDGFGGNSGAVPEFSTITTIIALAIVLSGFLAMRRRI